MSQMLLSEEPKIPNVYRDVILNFMRDYWRERRWEMEQFFGITDLPVFGDEQLMRLMVVDILAEIASAAVGEMEHSDDGCREDVVREGIQSLMERLFSFHGGGAAYTIPDEFWEAPIGEMVARAMLWIQRDELITLTEAAKLRGVTVQAISQAVRAGRLRKYVDPGARQRQGRVLVRRKEGESM